MGSSLWWCERGSCASTPSVAVQMTSIWLVGRTLEQCPGTNQELAIIDLNGAIFCDGLPAPVG